MVTQTSEKFPLPELGWRLFRLYGRAPNYTKQWRAVNSVQIPAERVGRTFMIAEADLPKIAEYFGLTDKPDKAA